MGIRQRDVGVGIAGLLLGLLLAFLLSPGTTREPPGTRSAAEPPPVEPVPEPVPAPRPAPVPSPAVTCVAEPVPPPELPARPEAEPPPDGSPFRIRIRNAEDGAPCRGLIVVASASGAPSSADARPLAVTTDGDGVLTLPGGTRWRLELRDAELQLFDGGRARVSGDGIPEAWCGRMTWIRGAVRLEDPEAAAGVPAIVEARVPAAMPRPGEDPPQGSPAWLRLHVPRDGVERKARVENGTYSLSVPAWMRDVRLLASAKGHVPQDRPLPALRPGEAYPNLDFELLKGARIPVAIVDGEGRPVAAAQIHAILARTMPEGEFNRAKEHARGGSWMTRNLPGEDSIQVVRMHPGRVNADGTGAAAFPVARVEGESAAVVILAEGFHPWVRRLDDMEGSGPLRAELVAAEPALPSYRIRGPAGFLPEGTVLQLLRLVDGVTYAVPGRSVGRDGRIPGTGLVRGESYGVTLVTTLPSGDRRHLEGTLTFGGEEILDASAFEVWTIGPLREGARR